MKSIENLHRIRGSKKIEKVHRCTKLFEEAKIRSLKREKIGKQQEIYSFAPNIQLTRRKNRSLMDKVSKRVAN